MIHQLLAGFQLSVGGDEAPVAAQQGKLADLHIEGTFQSLPGMAG
jgi:hypothetical protein